MWLKWDDRLQEGAGEEKERAERRLQFALGRFGERVGRVDVHLYDVNGPRGGIDKCCRLVARLPGQEAVVVEETDSNINALIDRAAQRLGEAVRRRLDRTRRFVAAPRPALT
jgi:putative sigma-54 modulation protein